MYRLFYFWRLMYSYKHADTKTLLSTNSTFHIENCNSFVYLFGPWPSIDLEINHEMIRTAVECRINQRRWLIYVVMRCYRWLNACKFPRNTDRACRITKDPSRCYVGFCRFDTQSATLDDDWLIEFIIYWPGWRDRTPRLTLRTRFCSTIKLPSHAMRQRGNRNIAESPTSKVDKTIH